MKHTKESSKTLKYVLLGTIAIVVFLIIGFNIKVAPLKSTPSTPTTTSEDKNINDPLYPKFQALSVQGNSSCSTAFKDSIDTMPEGTRLKGSCCSPMNWHRYKEQVNGLQKYKDVKEIPSDPYDIDASLAKEMQAHYDDILTPEQQKEYDYAMENSKEKGPCCCKCWRWYVYGGLAKVLIKDRGFTGKQIVEVWNLSDGCGGPGDHVNHT